MLNQGVQARSGATPATHAAVKPVSVARMEMKQGAMTETLRHDMECMLIVLQGSCRVYLHDQVVTVHENELLYVAAHHEHVAEALADSVMLSIAIPSSERTACGSAVQHDADQYLWGV